MMHGAIKKKTPSVLVCPRKTDPLQYFVIISIISTKFAAKFPTAVPALLIAHCLIFVHVS